MTALRQWPDKEKGLIACKMITGETVELRELQLRIRKPASAPFALKNRFWRPAKIRSDPARWKWRYRGSKTTSVRHAGSPV